MSSSSPRTPPGTELHRVDVSAWLYFGWAPAQRSYGRLCPRHVGRGGPGRGGFRGVPGSRAPQGLGLLSLRERQELLGSERVGVLSAQTQGQRNPGLGLRRPCAGWRQPRHTGGGDDWTSNRQSRPSAGAQQAGITGGVVGGRASERRRTSPRSHGMGCG